MFSFFFILGIYFLTHDEFLIGVLCLCVSISARKLFEDAPDDGELILKKEKSEDLS